MLNRLFAYVVSSARAKAAAERREAGRPSTKGVDVYSLRPTPRLTEAEKIERYRAGRFAEMTESQAGL